MTALAASLVDPIREGSFPESADLLSAELDRDAVPQLLKTIEAARNELSDDLRNVSKPYAGGIDQWIVQAKQVQEDIARCKQEARDIVEQHTRFQQLQKDTSDAEINARLLGDEITFTKGLQAQLRNVSTTHERLREVENLLRDSRAVEAADGLKDLSPAIQTLQGPRVQAVVSEYRDDLLNKSRKHLTDQLQARVMLTQEGRRRSLIIEDAANPSNEILFSALAKLDATAPLIERLDAMLERCIIQPLSTQSTTRLSSHAIEAGKLVVDLGTRPALAPSTILCFASDVATYLHAHLPPQLYKAVSSAFGPRLISCIVGDWLTPAIPVGLDDLAGLDHLKEEVLTLASSLNERDWPRTQDLRRWTQHAPRMWLAKRKSEALDAVRRAFIASSGTLHQVERIERQHVSTLDTTEQHTNAAEGVQSDWDASWDDDDEKPADTSGQTAQPEDDASGWGFEDDLDGPGSPTNGDAIVKRNKTADSDEEVDDAWGWNEESPESPVQTKKQKVEARQPAIGTHGISQPQEVVLTELYSITDIPDRLLETIGGDIQDAVRLGEEDHVSLKDVPASSGLLTLPSLSLAMFRATASIYYSRNTSLGNMNLYNDAVYMADKLRGMPRPSGMKDVDADCAAMEKFARSAYAREMDTQRTILGDLLDGVQGFTIPYAEQIEEAISATSDRLRQVNQDWSPVLSTSALLQSVGALYSSILSKVITDIEEMDDISEAQSQRLSNFCSQLSKLEDLFVAKPPGGDSSEQDAVSMVAVYTSNWLRFQYLDQILSASLVDIKFLWTEGELSLEFSAEEVVDLIKALFAESSHRRSAIAAIRGHRGSGMS